MVALTDECRSAAVRSHEGARVYAIVIENYDIVKSLSATMSGQNIRPWRVPLVESLGFSTFVRRH
jgi:hypothetical protein